MHGYANRTDFDREAFDICEDEADAVILSALTPSSPRRPAEPFESLARSAGLRRLLLNVTLQPTTSIDVRWQGVDDDGHAFALCSHASTVEDALARALRWSPGAPAFRLDCREADLLAFRVAGVERMTTALVFIDGSPTTSVHWSHPDGEGGSTIGADLVTTLTRAARWIRDEHIERGRLTGKRVETSGG